MKVTWFMVAVFMFSLVGAVNSVSSINSDATMSQLLAESDKKDDDKDDEEDGHASLKSSVANDCFELLVESGKKDDEKEEEVSELSCKGFCVASQEFQGSGRKENRRRRGSSSDSLA